MGKLDYVKVILIGIVVVSVGFSPMSSWGSNDLENNRGDVVDNLSVYIPDLCYSPTSHDFGYLIEGETQHTTFDIWNCGTDTLTWSLGIVHTWISPNPTSGSSNGEHDTVTVTIDTTGLSTGSYTGFVSISANDGGGLRYFDVEFILHEPPNIPNTPIGPSSGNEDVSYEYRTAANDPDGDQVQVRFDWGDGTYSSWSPLAASGTTFITTHAWSTVGTYAVKAQAKDEHGAASGWSSPLLVTIVAGNNPPDTPSIPSGPSYGNTETSYTYSTATTDSDGDQVKYYFDWGDGSGEWTSLLTSGTIVSVSHSWTVDDTYDVKVKAQDEHGAESGWSPVLNVTISSNNPPDKPSRPSGPTMGIAGFSYIYSATGIDIDSDQVYLIFDWADGTTSGWVGPYYSGDTVTASHIWSAQGSYSIKVKVKDEHGLESVWSDPLPVSMPYQHQTLLGLIIEWFQQLFWTLVP